MMKETMDVPKWINVMIYLPNNGKYDQLSVTLNKPVPQIALWDPESKKYVNRDQTSELSKE